MGARDHPSSHRGTKEEQDDTRGGKEETEPTHPRCAERRERDVHRDLLAPFRKQVDLQSRPHRADRHPGLVVASPVLLVVLLKARGDQRFQGPAQQFGLLISGQDLQLLAAEDDPPPPVGDQDPVGKRVQDAAVHLEDFERPAHEAAHSRFGREVPRSRLRGDQWPRRSATAHAIVAVCQEPPSPIAVCVSWSSTITRWSVTVSAPC